MTDIFKLIIEILKKINFYGNFNLNDFIDEINVNISFDSEFVSIKNPYSEITLNNTLKYYFPSKHHTHINPSFFITGGDYSPPSSEFYSSKTVKSVKNKKTDILENSFYHNFRAPLQITNEIENKENNTKTLWKNNAQHLLSAAKKEKNKQLIFIPCLTVVNKNFDLIGNEIKSLLNAALKNRKLTVNY